MVKKKLRCRMGWHKWKYIATIGIPAVKLFKCPLCKQRKTEPDPAQTPIVF